MVGRAEIIVLLGTMVWLTWSRTVVVDTNKGNDTAACGDDSSPCRTLNYTIAYWLPQRTDTLSFHIRNGSYFYSLNGSETRYQFISCDTLSIVGVDPGEVTISCGPGAGFAFLRCSNINITNIVFRHCGATQPGTSTANSTATETVPVSTALYFAFCTTVTLSFVRVSDSTTTGVVMYNTIESLLVDNSHFTYNSVNSSPDRLSNGGFYIEFCYCDPGVVSDNCVPHDNKGAKYIFSSSFFVNNNALKVADVFNRTFYIPYKTDYFSFGRGGGLSIVLKGTASENHITIDNCLFYGNKALWGGGIFIEFEDESKNNEIIVHGSEFLFNCVENESPSNGTGGGAARVDFLYFNHSLIGSHDNNVTFDSCSFFNNSANHGGGISLLTTPEQSVVTPTNKLILINCTFLKNYAPLGAGMDLSTWHSLKTGLPAMVTIQNCTFTDNGHSVTDGTVYADCVPVYFRSNVMFQGNAGSALSVFGTGVTFTDGCQAQFLNNHGWTGGGISLLGNAYIGIDPGSSFTFYNNSARVQGGGIYALLTSRHDILSSRNCFLQYKDERVHPNDWNVSFTFINNTAQMGSSIYTTSLLPCVWGASYGNMEYNLREVFNWTNVFHYIPNSRTQISSGIASLSPNTSTDFTMAPGNITKLPIDPLDDWKHGTQGSVWLYSSNDQVMMLPNLTADYQVTSHGHPGDTSQVLVVTNSPRNVSYTIHVTLRQCPPGYEWSQQKQTCQCGYENWHGILYCDDVSFTSYLARGYWAGYVLSAEHPIANESSLVTVKCPSQYCSNLVSTLFRRQLPSMADNELLDTMICGPQNRTGHLCGNCTANNGVAINARGFQFHCIHCSSTKYNWLVYLSTEFLPLTIFFFVIIIFDINIHSGVTSSIILFFQVFDALRIVSDDELRPPPYSSSLIKVIQFLYNIWNLQFFGSLLSPYCLAKDLSTMDILSINYAAGLFPFLLFFIVYLFNNMSFDRWFETERMAKIRHSFRRCWFHIKWRIVVKKSILSGLATVWMLTFTRLALISFLILSRTYLHGDTAVVTYQGTLPFLHKQHLRYAVPAIIVLILLVFLPAVSLFCFPLIPQVMGMLSYRIHFDNFSVYYKVASCLERPFIRLKPIIDCFQGSYRPHREYFAGLLFWYRLIIFIVFAFSVHSDTYFWNIVFSVIFLVVIGISQPFKKPRDNMVMLLSVANIIMISVLNIYLLDHNHGARQSSYNPDALLWWQLVLVLLPLVFILLYAMWKGMKKVQAWRRGVPPEGLYVNFSSDTPAEDPLLNFPAQIWYEDDDVSDDATQDNNHQQGSYRRSNPSRHDSNSLQRSSKRASDGRSQSDLDRRRYHTFSGTTNTSSYGATNNGSDQ